MIDGTPLASDMKTVRIRLVSWMRILRAVLLVLFIVAIGRVFNGEGWKRLYAIPLGFACQILLFFFDRAHQRVRDWRATRLIARVRGRGRDVWREPIPPFALYLRPFAADGNLPVPQKTSGEIFDPLYLWRGLSRDVETNLAEIIEHRGLTMIALGKRAKTLGSGRIQLTDDDWFSFFTDIAPLAARIFILPEGSPNLRQEIAFVREQGLLQKCIFVQPPQRLVGGIDVVDMWQRARKALDEMGLHAPKDINPHGAVFVLDDAGAVTALQHLGAWTTMRVSRAIVNVQDLDARWFISPIWLSLLVVPFGLVFLLVHRTLRALLRFRSRVNGQRRK